MSGPDRAAIRALAHDLNNIVAATANYAELLADDLPAGTQAHGFALHILRGQDAARDLVAGLLRLADGLNEI